MKAAVIILGALGTIRRGMSAVNALSPTTSPIVNSSRTTLNIDNFLDSSWREQIAKINNDLDIIENGGGIILIRTELILKIF